MADLEQMNWELAIAWLNTCIEELEVCVEMLDKAKKDIKDLRDKVE